MLPSNLTFPCQFPIKVFGLANEQFESTVVTIVRKYVMDLGENAIQVRASNQGKYTSITINIEAKSKEQLDAIYLELNANEHVLMTL